MVSLLLTGNVLLDAFIKEFYGFILCSVMTELRTLWINLGEPR
jgi:hypothetical protein